MTTPVYISITGLKLRRFWHAPAFWWHAVRSMSQAQRSEGCLEASTRTINGIHHTLSVWRDREAMLAFLKTGPHLKAMKVYHAIATGKIHGYTATEVPGWDEVHHLWQTKGQEV